MFWCHSCSTTLTLLSFLKSSEVQFFKNYLGKRQGFQHNYLANKSIFLYTHSNGEHGSLNADHGRNIGLVLRIGIEFEDMDTGAEVGGTASGTGLETAMPVGFLVDLDACWTSSS